MLASESTLLVYTNARRDYEFTVRRGVRDPFLESVVEHHVAKAFRKVIERPAFTDAVGVVGLPAPVGRLAAFRVFDVGTFRGRPHTLAVVALTLPVRSERAWPLSAALAQLLCPTPDSRDFPNVMVYENWKSAEVASPFAELDRWEESNPSPSPCEIVVFTFPPGLAPRIELPKGTARHRTRRQLGILTYVLALAVIGLCCVPFLLRVFDGSLPPDKSPSRPPKKTLDDGMLRIRMVEALVGGFFVTREQASIQSTEDLKRWVIAARSQATRNVGDLARWLNETSTASDRNAVAGGVRTQLARWEEPNALESSLEPVLETAKVEASVAFLEQYRGLYDCAKGFTESPRAEIQESLQKEVACVLDFK